MASLVADYRAFNPPSTGRVTRVTELLREGGDLELANEISHSTSLSVTNATCRMHQPRTHAISQQLQQPE